MQRLTIHLFISLATFIIGTAAANLWPGHHSVLHSQTAVEREVLSVEREYLDAHVRRDEAALDRILADDFIFYHCGRYFTTKAERLALMENPDFSFLSIDTSDVDVHVDGDEAVVTGEAIVRGLSHEREFMSPPYRYTRAYEKRDGRWQVVSVRVSRIMWRLGE
jgi:ketosteroid isomerase-like protein